MKPIKVSEASGAVLDWMVLKALGHDFIGFNLKYMDAYPFSTDWAQGGLLIERESIATRRDSNKVWYAMLSADLGDGEGARWSEFTFNNVPKTASTSRKARFTGNTMLIAAMRCYVASKLGDTVEVPDEI